MTKRLKPLKLVWLSLFVLWLIGMFFTMLYLELFFGLNGLITEVTTLYNIKSKESRIQYAINHWNNNESVLPLQIKNIESFKNIVGIGCIKCGSTYFHSMLRRTTRFWEKNNKASKYHFIFKWNEAHFFDQCKNCAFDRYLKDLIQSQRNDPLQYKSQNKIWIFGEKTVTYFDNYNAAHLLSFYGHRYDIYFYIVIRNPVNQIWSHIWMRTEGCNPNQRIKIQCILIRDENYYLQRDNTKHIMLMAQYLNNFLLYQIENELPIFYKIMNELSIDKTVNNDNNDDIDKDKIIELLIKRTSDILHYYSHLYISSCHFCNILLWYYQWNVMNQYKSIIFQDRFRIIQIDNVFQNHIVTNQYIKRLMCWMIGEEMNLNECRNKGMIKTEIQNIAYQSKHRHYAPDIIDILDLNVSNTIKAFYNDSLQRLIWFIDKHPNIMIGNTKFIPYW